VYKVDLSVSDTMFTSASTIHSDCSVNHALVQFMSLLESLGVVDVDGKLRRGSNNLISITIEGAYGTNANSLTNHNVEITISSVADNGRDAKSALGEVLLSLDDALGQSAHGHANVL
jgi:hypothetical protein